MILNIFGNQNEITQLPYHEFNWDEQIAVKKIIIEWISTKAIIGIVQSDLVDKNPFNPNQQLCSFTKFEGSTLTEVCFSDPVFFFVKTFSILQNDLRCLFQIRFSVNLTSSKNSVSRFHVRVQNPIGKASHTDSNSFQYTIASQLVHN